MVYNKRIIYSKTPDATLQERNYSEIEALKMQFELYLNQNAKTPLQMSSEARHRFFQLKVGDFFYEYMISIW